MNIFIDEVDSLEVINDIRESIKSEIKNRNETIARVAVLAGVSYGSLSRFLNGKNQKIWISTLCRIALALDMDVVIKPLKTK